ncbi:AraC family transcriptional regulator [Pelagicoccus mobilis]|uniref:Helix-turn-helix domain-containing protein n=1 Tax=Pelagicoccus mobilis TaxID=415221 RepID=A0A934S299_9BACT|nr:AraC family transcriptional regulator [Pelagicoccus mobilis]MBK1879316.1 helix-turn-helix domain-containing protein [Pelagicoccus mobilis]
MSQTYPDPQRLEETHFTGRDTFRRSTEHSDYPKMREKHGMLAAGHTVARQGNLFVRLNPSFSQILVSYAGEGVMLIDDRWMPLYPGHAYITPAGAKHAYFAKPDATWEFSWVIYEGTGPNSLGSAFKTEGPYMIEVQNNLLNQPLIGLYNESMHWHDEMVMDSWIQLLDTYVRRALTSEEIDPRLRRLWLKVSENLSHPWNCVNMAEEAKMSEEHLRRLCHQNYSQSPIQRLRSLRIKYASELLLYSNLSIEQISEEVGYNDAASLYRSFLKIRGVSPGKYRRQVRSH